MSRWVPWHKDASLLGAIRSACRPLSRAKSQSDSRASTEMQDSVKSVGRMGGDCRNGEVSSQGGVEGCKGGKINREEGSSGDEKSVVSSDHRGMRDAYLWDVHDGETVELDSSERLWDEYEGIRVLGEGVYGRVYLVKNSHTGEKVAFKRIYLSSKSRGISEHQAREIEVLKALRGHPHIIGLNKVYVSPPRAYISFPFIRNGTLGNYIITQLNDRSSTSCPQTTRATSRTSQTVRDTASSIRDHHSNALLARTEAFEGATNTRNNSGIEHDINLTPGISKMDKFKMDNTNHRLPYHMPVDEVKEVTRQLLSALAYLHNMDILHRDVKPDNILIETEPRDGTDSNAVPTLGQGLTKKAITTHGNENVAHNENDTQNENLSRNEPNMPIIKKVYLADFGLARSVGKVGQGQALSPEVVTLSYRPLELLLGLREYTTKIDIWSVGCILMEMLLGSELFTSSNEFSLITEIFTAFGTPTPREWPTLYDLPFMTPLLPKLQQSKENCIYAKLLDHKRLDVLNDHSFLDLISHMLQPSPFNRISAQDALNHPALNNDMKSTESK